MKLFPFSLALLIAVAGMAENTLKETPQVTLKMRQPNWRGDVVSMHPNSNPQQIIFYEPVVGGGEVAVKEVFFYENGALKSEVDVIQTSEGTIFHGAKVDLNEEGKLFQTAYYKDGLLEGERKQWYPNGQLGSVAYFEKGQLQGAAKSYFENGKLREEAHHDHGKLEGEYTLYYEDGVKGRFCTYHQGEVQGLAFEWYPSGVLRQQRQFSHGLLNGDGENPAILVYNEERTLIEVADFRQGIRSGLHIAFHKNGQEAYRISYKHGKKEGKEQ